MSDTATFPFDTSTTLDEEPAPGQDRRKLLLVLGAGVVVASVLGYFLAMALFGGAGEVTAPQAVRPPAPVASAAPSVSPLPAQNPVGAVTRNPFLPLVFPPATGGGAAAPAAAAPAAPAAPAAQAPPATTPGMTTFKVISIGGTQATVSVDGVRYTVSVGQSFARTFKLVGTSGGVCGDFTNSGSRLGLCEGQTLIF